MDLMWIIYFIDVVCGLHWPFIMAGIILAAGTVAWIPLSIEESKDDVEAYGRVYWRRILPICLPLLLVFSFIPNKQTAYTMLAAYGVTELAQNERVQELGSKSLEVIEKAMNQYLEESEK